MTTLTTTLYGTDCYDWHSARGLLPAPATVEIPATTENRWGDSPCDLASGIFCYDGCSDSGEGWWGFAFEAECSPSRDWTVTRLEPLEGEDCERLRIAHFGADWRDRMHAVLRQIQAECEQLIDEWLEAY